MCVRLPTTTYETHMIPQIEQYESNGGGWIRLRSAQPGSKQSDDPWVRIIEGIFVSKGVVSMKVSQLGSELRARPNVKFSKLKDILSTPAVQAKVCDSIF